MIIGQTIIVIDLGNYFIAEEVPFKAILKEITDYPCYWVQSNVTGKNYEVYETQILESFPEEDLKKLINLNNYGR